MAVTPPTYRPRVKPIEDRFFAKVEFGENRYEGTRCLLWTAAPDGHGYGAFWDGTRTEAGHPRTVRAHIWLYERWVGPVPGGLDLDHLCHNVDLTCPGGDTCPHRACVNPAHLEPVPRGVNLARSPNTTAGRVPLTHCGKGHELTPDNLYFRKTGKRAGQRACRQCALNGAARSVSRNRESNQP